MRQIVLVIAFLLSGAVVLFLGSTEVLADPALPVLQSTIAGPLDSAPFQGCSLSCALPWTMKSSSNLPQQGGRTYVAGNAYDNKIATAWAEGVPGDGVGEWIEFDLGPSTSKAINFGGFRIGNGYARTPQSFRDNGRVRRMRMDINGKPVFFVDLKDTPDEQDVTVPKLMVHPRDKIRFTIISVYPGARFHDTCITEMVLDGGH